MSGRRDLVLLNLHEFEHGADNVADALGSRRAAVALLRAMADYLDPAPAPTLFDPEGAA